MLALICCGMLALTGCISRERLMQIEAVAAQANQQLAQGEQAVTAAETALQHARTLAERTASDEALRAVTAAEVALGQAKETLPTLQRAAKDTAHALAAARAAQEAGASWWEILLAGGAALATGGTAGAALMGTRAAKIGHALRSTVQYIDQLKPAADEQLGKKARKELAQRLFNRSDVQLIETERARLHGQAA
jgi:hypothetical protein